MTVRVAALYVLAKSSPYADIEGVDLWPIKRDARLYRGPWSVVAHAPCGPWSRSVAHRTNPSPEQDPSLAVIAVRQVRTYGGVLEHPRRSRLWEAVGLPLPWPDGSTDQLVDEYGGFTMEVRQCDWGHQSEKWTWLYFVGVKPAAIVLPPCRDPPPPRRKSWRVRAGGKGAGWRCDGDLAGPTERKRTPRAFAQWLVDLAATAAPGRSP